MLVASMDTTATAKAYNRIASHWASEKFNHENGIHQHERALRFLTERGYAIDIGCGSSGRIIGLLLKHGFQTEGLDISSEMIALARKRHPDVTFHHADICQWEPLHTYSFISAWDSVWHVPLDQQEAMLRKLYAALAPSGVLITTTGGIIQPGDVTNPFLGEPLYTAAIGIPRFLQLLHESGCVCRHVEYDQWPERHVVIVAQRT